MAEIKKISTEVQALDDLRVVGDLTLDDDSGASPSLYLKNGDDNFWRIFNGSSLDLTFRVGTTTKFEIDSSGNVAPSGGITLGTSKSIYLNGSTDGLRILHDGSNGSIINQSTGDLKISNSATDKDIIFRGKDDASTIDALTLDMSDGGWANFNSGITVASTFSPSVFSGDVSILGDLNITGDINSASVTNLDVDDLTITVAKGAADSAAADGAGIVVDGAGASLLYDHTGTQWEVNKPFEVKVGTSAISMTEYSDGAAIFLDGSDGDFTGSDYYNVAAYGGGGGSKLSFGYGAAEKMYMDKVGNLWTGGVIDVKGTGVSTMTGAFWIKGSGYHQLKIANNLTADTNKQSGIVTENYEGNNVSIIQTFQQNNNNAIYYGSADSAFAGVQNHYFYVNADSDTAGSGHTKAFEIKADAKAGFYGHVELVTGNSTGKFAVMSTGVHSSYDFYNNGTSYFNGAVTIDDNLTMPTNSHIEMGGNFTIQGTDGSYFQRIKTIDSAATDPVDTFSFDVKLGSSAAWKSLLVLDQHDDARFSGSASFAGGLTIPDYINHTGDSGTKFGFSADDTFVVRTGGAVRLTVNDTSTTFAGKVGIGGAPTFDLDIQKNNGRIRMLGTTGYSAIELQNDANGFYVARNGATADSFATGNTAYAGILAVQGNHNLEFATNGVVRQTISGTGDLTLEGVAHIKKGITCDGNAKFYNWRALANTLTSSNLYYRIARITGAQSTRFIIELAGRSTSYGDTSLPAYGKLVGQLNNDNNYDLTYYNHSTSNSEVVTHIGQVDISTTETDIYIKVGQFAEVTAIAHISDGSITTYESNSGSTTKPTGYTDPTVAKVWNTLNDGPGSGLDADTLDGVSGEDFLRSNINDTASGSISFTNSYNEFGNSTGSVSNDGSWNARVNVAGSSHARLDVKSVSDGIITTMYSHTGHAAGRVGTMSNHKLDFMIYGQPKARLETNGTFRAAGDVVAYYSFSDKRLKTNIKTTENNLEKILSLNPVEYTWKEGYREGIKEIGLIAQEVEGIIPEVVREQERLDEKEETFKTVDYEHLVSTLIGAMQEQQKQIEELKSQMAACNARSCNCK